MKPIACSVTVEAPIERTFDVFTDLRGAERRLSGVTRMEVLTDGPVRTGTVWRETRIMFGREATEQLTVDAFERPTLIRIVADSRGMHYDTAFHFESLERADSGSHATRVTLTFSGRATSLISGLMSLVMGPLFSGAIVKELTKDLEELKTAVETEV